MKVLPTAENFLGIEDESLYSYENSHYVIQQVPYEHTSSYLQGSDKGPGAIVAASHFVEFYDEELDTETLYDVKGIATVPALDFTGKVDQVAVDYIEAETDKLINDGKFVISVGSEHTVTYGFVKAHAKKYANLSVLQIDAHSDLRLAYHNNPYSHASVMARVFDMGINLTQIGIRAQCQQERDLIKNNPQKVHTFYAHTIRQNPHWMKSALDTLTDNVYLTIDADGFDPSIMPAVGTAEPGGLFWRETLDFIKLVAKNKNIVGFDIVECAPFDVPGQTLSEYTLAKLLYRIVGYIAHRGKI